LVVVNEARKLWGTKFGKLWGPVGVLQWGTKLTSAFLSLSTYIWYKYCAIAYVSIVLDLAMYKKYLEKADWAHKFAHEHTNFGPNILPPRRYLHESYLFCIWAVMFINIFLTYNLDFFSTINHYKKWYIGFS
jgi:hypothetical protein